MQYALENSLIDLAYVQEQIEMNKRKELIENHPYSIWQGKDGKWRTYLPDEEKERKKALKKRNTRKEIEDVVVAYWKSQIPSLQKHTFQDVYLMWRTVQNQLVSDNTVAKYETDYNRFFKDTDFAQKDIKRMLHECSHAFIQQKSGQMAAWRLHKNRIFRNRCRFALSG